MKKLADKIRRVGIIGNLEKADAAVIVRKAAKLVERAGRKVYCDTATAQMAGIKNNVRPDAKTQVTINYRNEGGRMIPLRVHTVVISTQHQDGITNEFIRKELMDKVSDRARGLLPRERHTECVQMPCS